jgi:hypothetical protein
MSQLAPVRPLRTSARRSSTPPRSLRVVTAPDPQGNAGFVAVCVGLLLAGFIGVLMLNTAMAKGSYTMRDLQHRSDELTDSQDALRHAIDEVSGPGPLAKRAQSLGMVPAETAAFLRLSDGAVLGVAKAAKKNDRFSVVTEGTSAPAPRVVVPTSSTPPATASTFLRSPAVR